MIPVGPDPFIPASIAEATEDLAPGTLAQLASDDPAAVRAALRQLRQRHGDRLPASVLRQLFERARGAKAHRRGALKSLEPAYLAALREREQAAGQESSRQSFLEDFVRRLTFIGGLQRPRVWSHLGWIDDDPLYPLALSRDRGHTILASGIPGAGKTLFSTLIGESCFLIGEPLCAPVLQPTAHVFVHLEENDRLPQLLDGLLPNPVAADLDLLKARLGVDAAPLPRVRIAIPTEIVTDELMHRLRPYQELGLDVRKLHLHLGELGQPGLEAALGAETGARYIQRVLEAAQDQGRKLRTEHLREFIDGAEDLNETAKKAARARLRVLTEIESPEGGPGLWDLVEPGVSTVFYLGGPHMGRGRVSPILVCLLSGLMMQSPRHGAMHRLIEVDEINLLEGDEPVWRMLCKGGRLARHRGWTLVLMGQDWRCVPDDMFSTVGVTATFRQSSPQLFEHQRQRVGGLSGWRFDDAAQLATGVAIMTSLEATDGRMARRVRFRPLLCMHGGFTRAVI